MTTRITSRARLSGKALLHIERLQVIHDWMLLPESNQSERRENSVAQPTSLNDHPEPHQDSDCHRMLYYQRALAARRALT